MSFGGAEGIAPPPQQYPDLDHWFAAIIAELQKASLGALTNDVEGRVGAVTPKNIRELIPMGSGATAVSTSITVPSGARLVAVALNVDVAVTNDGDNTWAAAFSGGSTTTIAAAGTAATINTKISLLLPDEITTGVTEITFTPQAANFTAGSIEAVVWYEELTPISDV